MGKKERKISVLIATGIYPPDIGGPATYSKLLEDELPSRGVSVSVVSFGSVRMLPKGISHIVYFFTLLVRGLKADILYALDPVSVGFPTFLASNVLKKPFILRVAGDYAWEQGTARFGITESLDTFSEKNTGYPFFVRILKFFQKRTAAGADLVVVPSKYLKRIVSNWGIKEKNITVIYNAFDVPESIAKKEVLRKMMNLSGDIIISVGRLVPWKGFSALVRVMKRIVTEKPNAKLLIIGSGVEEKNLRRQIEKENANDYVTLVGRLDHETLLRYVQAADLFVLNTNYEGLSHQILECMALSVPVITTPVGGNVEVITHKENGLMVPFNDEKELERSILLLLRDKETRDRISENAKKKVAEFDKEKMLKSIIQVFQKI